MGLGVSGKQRDSETNKWAYCFEVADVQVLLHVVHDDAVVSRRATSVVPVLLLCNPSLHNSGKGVTHNCTGILDGYFLVSMIFRMVHPIPTSSFFQLNDFCTCILYTHVHATT